MKQTQTNIQTAESPEALASTCAFPSGPPFLSPWCKAITPDVPMFWQAVGLDPWTGGWVMQHGVDPHPASTCYTSHTLAAGFHWEGYLPAGYHTFLVRFATGPVTVKPGGGQASAELLLKVDGQVVVSQNALSKTVQYLRACRYLNAGTHSIFFGGRITLAFSGLGNPYAEIINTTAELTYFEPYAQAGAEVPAAAAAPEGVSGEEEKLNTAEINARTAAESRLLSLIDTVSA